MNLLTMDPGDNTALVFWSDMKKPVEDFFVHLTPKQKKLSIAERQQLLTDQIEKKMQSLKYFYPGEKFKFIVEGVNLWGADTKSNAAAQRGDLFRLAYIVGGMVNTFQKVFGELGEVDIISVQSWKGQLPTPTLIKEVERYTGAEPKNEHVACAIGIGMNYFGKL